MIKFWFLYGLSLAREALYKHEDCYDHMLQHFDSQFFFSPGHRKIHEGSERLHNRGQREERIGPEAQGHDGVIFLG